MTPVVMMATASPTVTSAKVPAPVSPYLVVVTVPTVAVVLSLRVSVMTPLGVLVAMVPRIWLAGAGAGSGIATEVADFFEAFGVVLALVAPIFVSLLFS